MPIALLLTIGLHMAGALFWLLTSLVLGFGQPATASTRLFRPQMVAATVAVFSGGGLWTMLHPGSFGRPEMVLAAGAVMAIAAAGVQGALVGGGVRRLPDPAAAAKVLRGQKIASVLLLLTFACMMLAKHV
ncbi:MAG TPA: hypothetical protein VGM25_17540 [Caulobacteraceae bacterium]|jgi:hypothetical protein